MGGSFGFNGKGEQEVGKIGDKPVRLAAQGSNTNGIANGEGLAGAKSSASTGYGSDKDNQSSVTQSGINTKNIQIQQDPTGELAKFVYTDISTETAAQHSGSLKNSFDKDKVQQEIDLQVKVSQDFNRNVQAANGEINKQIDTLKQQLDKGQISQSKYDRKVSNWQNGSILLNSIAAGLGAPTDSVAGMATATLAPAVSYQIGQEFKKSNEEGSLKHILAHAIVGAVVAQSGGNNALAGALSAGGAEALAPKVAEYLYGKKGSELNAEQKETVSSIMSLAGAASGYAVGGDTANAQVGGVVAKNAVENNELVIFTEYKNGKPIIKPQPNKGMLGAFLEKLMPATMSGNVRDEKEAAALREIAKLRSEVTGPLVLTAAYSPYVAGAVVVSPEVFAAAKNACMLNPAGCTELGIGIAEIGVGVPMINPVNVGNATRSVVGKVNYGSTDLSQMAIAYAQKNGITGGRNIAIFEYIDLQGKIQTITKASERGKGHAERLIAIELQNKGIPNANVTRIYSELEPCSTPGGYCSNMIQHGSSNGLGPYNNAKVTFSFNYGGILIMQKLLVKV